MPFTAFWIILYNNTCLKGGKILKNSGLIKNFLELLKKILLAPIDNRLTTINYLIKTKKLTNGQSVRIVLISDLHGTVFGENQCDIAQKIKEQKPDIIALAGDIFDAKSNFYGTELFLKAIKDIAPVYFVYGNHECRSKNSSKIRELLNSYNINVLESTYKEIRMKNVDIIIGGMDDPDIAVYQNPHFDWQDRLINGFSELKTRPPYKILLSHRPDLIMYYKKTYFDLVLSGHAHGGQVRIPHLINGLFAPNQGIFPRYAGGLYKHKNLRHIVSRGASINPRIPRIFNPPELVVIDILAYYE